MAEPWEEEMRKALASEDSSLAISDSSELQEQVQTRKEKAKELLRKLEEDKAFTRLYRESQQGGLVQVVRRKAFSPRVSVDCKRIQLRDPHVAPSPLPFLTSDPRNQPDSFRFPYWNFLPKQSLQSSIKPAPALTTHRRTNSIQIYTKTPSFQVILPQVKVKKRVPSLDQLLTSRKDLGLDIGEEEFTKRFQGLSRQNSSEKVVKKTTKPREKQQKAGIDLFASEDQRGKRELIDRAKVLFASGVFSRSHSTEKAERDRELMGWLRYC